MLQKRKATYFGANAVVDVPERSNHWSPSSHTPSPRPDCVVLLSGNLAPIPQPNKPPDPNLTLHKTISTFPIPTTHLKTYRDQHDGSPEEREERVQQRVSEVVHDEPHEAYAYGNEHFEYVDTVDANVSGMLRFEVCGWG